MYIRCLISNQDINIFLEAIVQSAPLVELYETQKTTIALLYAVMSPEQRDDFRHARWYFDGINNIILNMDGHDQPMDRVIDRVHELLNQPIDVSDSD